MRVYLSLSPALFLSLVGTIYSLDLKVKREREGETREKQMRGELYIQGRENGRKARA